MPDQRPRILITNDDGIQSPGLAAVAAALDDLGDLLLVAPQKQQTSMSRARTQSGEYNGLFKKHRVIYGKREWEGIGINSTPAVCVDYAVFEISPGPIDLVISGINYGENIGTCVTVSGTIGAAIEAAERGIPALAVSLELPGTDYHTLNKNVDFSAAMAFTRQFAIRVLAGKLPEDVDILKIEIPAAATPQTPWIVTNQDRLAYYMPHLLPREDPYQQPGILDHTPQKGKFIRENSDAYAQTKGWVSVTPLSINLTSRTNLSHLQSFLS
jgi:5'-nucleotidase